MRDRCPFGYLFNIFTDAFRRLCTSPQPYERDECAYFGNLCKNGRCVDTRYSYRCDCYQGYKIDELGIACIGNNFCNFTMANMNALPVSIKDILCKSCLLAAIWHYSRYGLNPITLMLPVN